MREIRFRGFHKDEKGEKTIFLNEEEVKGTWVYGGIYHVLGTYRIKNMFAEFIVETDTIGEFIGLHDKNGNDIYEGDIMWDEGIFKSHVVYDEGAFGLKMCWGLKSITKHPKWNAFEIIGNIHDNPELVGVEKC